MKYSITVPVYNSGATLDELTERLNRVFNSLKEAYEIIFIDDGSNDNSWKKIIELKSKFSHIKAFRLARNFGQHNALMCGFGFANGQYVITLDDDLQHMPEDIPKLIEKIEEGYDLVYGVYKSKKHSFWRNFGSKFIKWAYNKALSIRGEITSFRIIRLSIIKKITKYDKNFTFIDGFIAWHTTNIGYVEVDHKTRKVGRTGYSLRKIIVLSMNLITNFSIFPLQIASFLGIIFSTLGFIMALTYFLLRIFSKITLSGFATIIIVLTIFSGVQLFILGLMGEYLGRIQLNINSKPQYNIREEAL